MNSKELESSSHIVSSASEEDQRINICSSPPPRAFKYHKKIAQFDKGTLKI
jgi:hypothetical protein